MLKFSIEDKARADHTVTDMLGMMMIDRITCCTMVLLVMVMPSAWADQALPTGWRPATDQEVYMASIDAPLAFQSARGDLDGDGAADQALIGVEGNNASLALLVKLSAQSAWLTLRSSAYDDQLGSLGVQMVTAPEQAVYCTSSDVGCDQNHMHKVSLPHGGLLVVNPDGNLLLVWDADQQTFTEHVVGL